MHTRNNLNDPDRFQPKLSWSSLNDNLIESFYRPALKNAILYQRKAGYFSSTSFVGITKEIIELIENNGRIQLITSPNFSASDKNILEKSITEREDTLSKLFFDDLLDDPDDTKQNFVKLMAYMLVHKVQGRSQLEIKIALTDSGTGIFHEKLGIIYYPDNEAISFSGSVNETISGWSKNIENFKVFTSWSDETNKQAIEDDKKSFDSLWRGNISNVKIFDLPTAVKEHMLKISPKSDAEYKETLEKVCQSIGYKKQALNEFLRDYQIEAKNNWIRNNYRGLFTMATGTGKTFTALGCINQFQHAKKRTMTIIACPQTHLVDQWKREVGQYNSHMPESKQVVVERDIICYGENHSWKNQFECMMNDFNRKLFGGGYIVQHVLIYVTHATLNSKDFKEFIQRIDDAEKLLIVDEVHNIGADLSQRALLEEYNARLGLSATPVRHYDPEGTKTIMAYFDDVVFELSLEYAIKKEYLCGYDYHPYYVELNSDEMDMYEELTRKIAVQYAAKKSHKHTDEKDNFNPEIKRSNLVANAQNKIDTLTDILDSGLNIKQTLIYCTSNPSPVMPLGSPSQLKLVKQVLSKNNIISTSVTFENPTKDRTIILDTLSQGHYDCITAVRCLDEGVDIPSVEIAIIMASSGNPRQYIQRRGRVLRQSSKTGKQKAVIYDLLVKPPVTKDQLINLRERKLVAREMLRHKEFALLALNKESAIEKIKEVADTYNIDFQMLDSKYIDNMN